MTRKIRIETRPNTLASIRTRNDRPIHQALKSLNHSSTQVAVFAERQMLSGLALQSNDRAAASAFSEDELLFLTATVYSPDGTQELTSSHAATPQSRSAEHLKFAATEVAASVVNELLGNGAAEITPGRRRHEQT